jgi:hypothetical protein
MDSALPYTMWKRFWKSRYDLNAESLRVELLKSRML